MALQIKVYYLSGNFETFNTTLLSPSFGGACAIENDFLHQDDWREKGIRWSRGYRDFDGRRNAIVNEAYAVRPEDLENIERVTVDGDTILQRSDAGILVDKFDEDWPNNENNEEA